MNTKLTLRINKRTIERAKRLASTRNTSVSKLVENYLELLSNGEKDSGKDEIKITPLVKSLSGVVKLPKNYNYKKDYSEYLSKKYK